MRSKKDQGSPTDYPAPPPPSASPGDFGYFETVMNLNAQMGGLKEAVDTLKIKQSEQTKKLDRISHQMYAGIVLIVVLTGVIGFFAKTINDLITHTIMSATQQQQTQPQPAPQPQQQQESPKQAPKQTR